MCTCEDGCLPVCKWLCKGLGAAILPHGHVDSSTRNKGPFLCHTMLPQASRDCCFEDGSAPTQLMGFLPLRAAARDGGGLHPRQQGRCWHHIPSRPLLPPWESRAVGAGTQQLAHHTVTGAVRVSCNHRNCHRPTAWEAGAAGEPFPLPSPSSSRAHPQVLGCKIETPCKFPSPKPALARLSLSCWLLLGDL